MAIESNPIIMISDASPQLENPKLDPSNRTVQSWYNLYSSAKLSLSSIFTLNLSYHYSISSFLLMKMHLRWIYFHNSSMPQLHRSPTPTLLLYLPITKELKRKGEMRYLRVYV